MGTNKYEHASFLMLVFYFNKIQFLQKRGFCVFYNLQNFGISIIFF